MRAALLLMGLVSAAACDVGAQPARVEIPASERTLERLQQSGTFAPVIAGGEIEGFRVGVRPGFAFERMGLRTGDVILSVNSKLAWPNDILDSLASEATVELRVRSSSGERVILVTSPKE